MKNQYGLSTIILLLIIALAGAGLLFVKQKYPPEIQNEEIPVTVPENKIENTRHSTFVSTTEPNFELEYPKELGEPAVQDSGTPGLLFGSDKNDLGKILQVEIKNKGRGGIIAGVQHQLIDSITEETNQYQLIINTYEVTETNTENPEYAQGKLMVEGILLDSDQEEILYMKNNKPLSKEQADYAINLMKEVAGTYREY